MDAALRSLGEHGFAGLTIDGIASEAGITRPVVYDLFGDLGGLLSAVADDAFARADVAIEAALPVAAPESSPEELLTRALRTLLDAVRSEPGSWRFILLPPLGAPPHIESGLAARRSELIDRITPLAAWALRELGIAGVDHAVVARVLVATAEDLARMTLEHPRRYPPTRLVSAISGLVRLLPAAQEAGHGD
jgi:AcrR family transcriptional regulator